MKLTEWYPGDVKPVRIGIYEREIPNMGIRYSFWNGEFWGLYGEAFKSALESQNARSEYQHLSWRGVSKLQARRK